MDLILWRHADAGQASDEPDDIDRKLSSRGELQAERMAKWLDQRLPESARVWVSPATRAQQTANALQRQQRTEPLLTPDADWQEALRATGFPKSKHPLLLIGHQPMLGLIAARLLTSQQIGSEEPKSMSIAKGAVVWLRHRSKHETNEVVLRALLSPEFV